MSVRPITYMLIVYIVVLLTFFVSTVEAHNDAVFALRPIESPGSGGSGFLIQHKGETLLVSNRHVCEISDSGVFVIQNSKIRSAAVVVRISETDDLCLLRPAKRLDVKGLHVGRHGPTPGSIVHTDGYPFLLNQTRSIGVLRSYEVQTGFYAQNTMITMGKTSFIAIPGMSGSPMFDINGDVIGVVARRALHDTQSCLFVTLDRLQRFLAETDTTVSTKKKIKLHAAQAALKHDMEFELLLAIIEVESSFNHLAIGKDGEIGTMQLHPKWHSPRLGDIEWNIEKGTEFLLYLKKRFESTDGDAWFVRYNHGPNSGLKNPKATEYYKRVRAVLERQ